MCFRFGISAEFYRVPCVEMGKAESITTGSGPARVRNAIDFPLNASIGALIRFTHRAFADDLQAHLLEHRVNVGMWYFLRALWEQDPYQFQF